MLISSLLSVAGCPRKCTHQLSRRVHYLQLLTMIQALQGLHIPIIALICKLSTSKLSNGVHPCMTTAWEYKTDLTKHQDGTVMPCLQSNSIIIIIIAIIAKLKFNWLQCLYKLLQGHIVPMILNYFVSLPVYWECIQYRIHFPKMNHLYFSENQGASYKSYSRMYFYLIICCSH